MSDFWKWYLALCLSITLMVAAFQLRINTPPVDNGYPVAGYPEPNMPPAPTLCPNGWISVRDGQGAFYCEPKLTDEIAIPQP